MTAKNSIPSSKLYIIPVSISEDGNSHIPDLALKLFSEVKVWCVENGKTFRQFLKSLNLNIKLSDCTYIDYDKHISGYPEDEVIEHLKNGQSVGLVSEAGIPTIADPGNKLIYKVHQEDFQVVPVSGPSSISLALMASGLNGQQFTFYGYLPVDSKHRSQKLKELSQIVLRTGASQIFMETPYRNQKIAESILNSCSNDVKLCIATSITSSEEKINTYSVGVWKKKGLPDIHKKPSIFILGRS